MWRLAGSRKPSQVTRVPKPLVDSAAMRDRRGRRAPFICLDGIDTLADHRSMHSLGRLVSPEQALARSAPRSRESDHTPGREARHQIWARPSTVPVRRPMVSEALHSAANAVAARNGHLMPIGPDLAHASGRDFSQPPLVTDGSITLDQTPPDAGAPPPPPPVASPAPATVDRIDVITSAAGAVTGHPAITSGNLDVPGPFNDPSTHGVNNVLQIHFHLGSGKSADLTPRREIQRSAWFAGTEQQNPPSKPLPPGQAGPPTPGGFGGVLVGPDGPGAHEVRRPSDSLLSVADAPGMASLSAAQCPFKYQAHFTVTVANPTQDVAQAKYDVLIEKKTPTEVPNTQNTLTAVTKTDLLNHKALP